MLLTRMLSSKHISTLEGCKRRPSIAVLLRSTGLVFQKKKLRCTMITKTLLHPCTLVGMETRTKIWRFQAINNKRKKSLIRETPSSGCETPYVTKYGIKQKVIAEAFDVSGEFRSVSSQASAVKAIHIFNKEEQSVEDVIEHGEHFKASENLQVDFDWKSLKKVISP